MLINPYCSNRGWLFEDFKDAFESESSWRAEWRRFVESEGFSTSGTALEVRVKSSNDPLPDADAWICIRTSELDRSPDLSRTVVQVHDFWPQRGNMMVPSAMSFVHPEQETIWRLDRLPPAVRPKTLTLPIGARRAFRLRESMPEHFTVGWVGRNMRNPRGEDQKRPHLLAEALKELRQEMPVHCIVLSPDESIGRMMCTGDGQTTLVHPLKPGRTHSFEQLEKFYHSIDVLVVTSLPEPGPLSVYEALRCGVPVVRMHDGPEPPPGEPWERIYTASHSLTELLASFIPHERRECFICGAAIRASMPYFQKDWIAANVKLAVEVAGA